MMNDDIYHSNIMFIIEVRMFRCGAFLGWTADLFKFHAYPSS